jgi:GT2 family glycosyltransferase
MRFAGTPPVPAAVRVIDLHAPLAALDDVAAYELVRVVVAWDGRPIGVVDVRNAGRSIGTDELRDAIVRRLGWSVLQSMLAEQWTALATPAPALQASVSVSVVVATYDRPTELARCLGHLRAQDTRRDVEIVVVDNHPASGLTRPVVAAVPGVVLVEEPRQGLAYARNAGFLAARGAVVACTDDDVIVPRGWLEALVAPFAERDVMAVTGNVLPLELETPAQWFYEMYGGLGRGFERQTFDGAWFRSFRSAVPTWNLGATANAAFRASAFRHPAIGLMDEALGPGMPSGVGEDTYLFYRVLAADFRLVYEPAAFVWHRHRRDMAALRRQMFGYAKGHVAYHLTTWLRDGDRRGLVRLALRIPPWHARQLLRWAYAQTQGTVPYPLSLVLLEIAGHIVGPLALWRSRRRVRREGRSASPGGARPAPTEPLAAAQAWKGGA